MMDINRVLDRLSELERQSDWPAAKRHLEYWLNEAEVTSDFRSFLQLHNELMGLCRKMNLGDEAISHAEKACALLEQLDLTRTATAGTVWLNAATVYKAFGQPEKSLTLFRQASDNYKENLSPNDVRFGGLCNNMALCLTDLKRYEEAFQMYENAYAIMGLQDQGALEQAITRLNQADLAVLNLGSEQAEPFVSQYIEEAYALLNRSDLIRNGYFAFVCDKCAPVFGYYGYFLYEKQLTDWSKEIHERT